MASKQYTSDSSPDRRKVRPEVVISLIVVVGFLVAMLFVYYDTQSNRALVDESKNEAVLSSTQEVNKAVTYVEPDFRVDLPEGWQKVNNPEITIGGIRYYPTRFQAVERIQAGRRLDVYIDQIPASLPLNKIHKVEVDGDEIVPDFISSYCADLVEIPRGEESSNHQITWEGLSFNCKPSKSSNAIGAIETSTKNALEFVKEDGTEIKMLLVFQDHSMRVNDGLFTQILESFKLR